MFRYFLNYCFHFSHFMNFVVNYRVFRMHGGQLRHSMSIKFLKENRCIKSTAGKRVISHCFPKLRTLRLLKLFKTFLCHSFRTYLQDRIENLVMLFCFSISTKIFVRKNYSNLLLNDVCSRKGKVMLIFMWSV